MCSASIYKIRRCGPVNCRAAGTAQSFLAITSTSVSMRAIQSVYDSAWRGRPRLADGKSEERRVGKKGRYWRDWSSDVCSSDLQHRVSSPLHLPLCPCAPSNRCTIRPGGGDHGWPTVLRVFFLIFGVVSASSLSPLGSKHEPGVPIGMDPSGDGCRNAQDRVRPLGERVSITNIGHAGHVAEYEARHAHGDPPGRCDLLKREVRLHCVLRRGGRDLRGGGGARVIHWHF